MYQIFDDVSSPAASGERVKALQRELKSRKLKGFLVPHSDEHQDEFLAPPAERLAWLTGFTGSAGVAIVLEKAAALFVDGRYTLQARAQTDATLFEVLQTPDAKASSWIAEKLAKGAVIGYDPALHTIREIERLTETLGKSGIKLAAVDTNLVDLIWQDRPKPSAAEIVPHGLEYAGKSAHEKIRDVQALLKDENIDAVLLTMLDSIAWLFNIRGGDIRHTPVALAFAIVPASGKPTLYIDPAKVGDNVKGSLREVLDLAEPAALMEKLKALGEARARVRLDPDSAPIKFAQALQADGVKFVPGQDPCIHPKAIKNAVEIKGARAAHLRDGVAMVRFLAWLDEVAELGKIDEIAAAMKLEDSRRESGQLRDISFDTISAVGAERRHRALPADHQEQAPAGIGPALSHRFRRAISRRHHRRHPHHRHRHADNGDEAALRAGAEGAYRHRHRALPQGHARARPRPLRAQAALGGGARFRSRHGAWRRQLSFRA